MSVLLPLLFFLGCSDYIVSGIEKRQPSLLVHPTHLSFGHLESGYESGTEIFSVINTGDEDLIITSPELVSGNARFALDNLEDEYTIPAGEVIDFEVYYEPKTYESNGGFINLYSNDEENKYSKITLEGYGDAPVMNINPPEFDYGLISIGCDNEERITIKNDGNMNLEITSMSQMVTQPVDILFELGSLPQPPWLMEPEQEIDFLVSYIPTDIGADDSQITIQGNDPFTPEVTVTQFGTGDVEQWFQHQWQQEQIPILDVLWVIDNSGSMSPFQQGLSANIGSFMSAFVASGADYRMAVITTDRSTFSTVINWNTPNAEILLGNLVITGVMGSGTERGIEMAYNSLNDSQAAGPGGNFFRGSAKLVVIFVSDERDWSSAGWISFVPFFDGIKPAGDFIPYGVFGDVPGGCQYQYGNYVRTAQEGLGYWDLIDHYGGNWYSICASDWGVQLQDLAGEVTGRKNFVLDEQDPIETTISVAVNGQVTSDWYYDSGINAVIFNEGHVPTEGQTIIIDYAIWGCGSE